MLKKFVKKIFFFLLFILVLVIVLISLPLSSTEKNSYLYGIHLKDSLLTHTPDPRIIFIGGSNLAFGLNSQLIKDSMKCNPINLGLHAAIGLEYMLKSTEEYVHKNDLVVVVPEYEFLCGESICGSETLLRVIACQGMSNLTKIPFDEQLNTLIYTPKYAMYKFTCYASKLPYLSFLSGKNLTDSLKYNSHVFNQYGDVRVRWIGGFTKVSPYVLDGEHVNKQMINRLVDFKKIVENKGAKLYIGFPALQEKSFESSKSAIYEITSNLEAQGFELLGSPSRYLVPDSLLYDTPYHLSLNGCNVRTELLIADLKKMCNK